MMVLFLRAPVVGRCKTRLIPALGAEGATRLYRAMAEDVVATACATGAPVRLSVAGRVDDPWVQSFGLPIEPQADGDLGARLSHALRDGGLAVGTDAPTLPSALLRRAAEAADVVFGPAFDGGYTLVGLPRVDGIFDGIPWSSPDTLAASVERAVALGRSVTLLDFWYDVDEPADLQFLRHHLRVLPPAIAPHTRALLAEL